MAVAIQSGSSRHPFYPRGSNEYLIYLGLNPDVVRKLDEWDSQPNHSGDLVLIPSKEVDSPSE